MAITGIYKITSPTGRIYIGQSWDIEERFKQHKNPRQPKGRKLKFSMLKHGANLHSFEILHTLPPDVAQNILDDYECFYIEHYTKSGIKMLNCKEGGSTGKHSAETRELLSLQRKGKPNPWKSEEMKEYNRTRVMSAETIEKIRTANKNKYPVGLHPNIGIKRSDETKRKISEAKKGKMIGTAHPLYGKPRPDAVKEALRKANTGKKASEETKAKMRERIKAKGHPRQGKKLSDESKEKMRQSALNRSQESKNRIAEANRRRFSSYKKEAA